MKKIFVSVIDRSAKIYISKIVPYLNAQIFSTSAEIRQTISKLDEMSVVGMPNIAQFFVKMLEVIKFLNSQKIDIGIFCDSPDFNILLGIIFKRIQKTKSVYFIPPTVWAWRPERKQLVENIFDKVLLIFPFEKNIWTKNGVYIGHPICRIIEQEKKQWESKKHNQNKKYAFLPGSRISEIKNHREIIDSLWKYFENAQIIVPTDIFWEFPSIYKIIPSKLSRWAMYISDTVITASGTSALESSLLGKPTVVFYKLPKITFEIAKRMVNINFISLPNIILGEKVFPELIQDDANPERIKEETEKIKTKDFSQISQILFEKLYGLDFPEIAKEILD